MDTLADRLFIRSKEHSEKKRLKGRFIDITFALMLLILTSPVLATICVLILLRNGRPILYRGTRLGLAKGPFTIYKFRTLVPDAQQILGSKLLENEKNLVTPFGDFLRATRLDELPQLFNVIGGDMELIGPRPVRPEVYENLCRKIPGYEMRFKVRPGLIGPSQLFTPHGCPKLIRTIIDNRFVRQEKSAGKTLYFLWITALAVAKILCKKVATGLHPDNKRKLERRREERICPENARVYICDFSDKEDYKLVGSLSNINLKSFRVRLSQPLEKPDFKLARLEIDIGKAGCSNEEKRLAFVECSFVRHCHTGDLYDYVWNYQPLSILGHFVIHQYFLGGSLAKLE